MKVLMATLMAVIASGCATSEYAYLRKVQASIHVGMRRSEVVKVLGKPVVDVQHSAFYGLPIHWPPDVSPLQAYTVVILYRDDLVEEVYLHPSKK